MNNFQSFNLSIFLVGDSYMESFASDVSWQRLHHGYTVCGVSGSRTTDVFAKMLACPKIKFPNPVIIGGFGKAVFCSIKNCGDQIIFKNFYILCRIVQKIKKT